MLFAETGAISRRIGLAAAQRGQDSAVRSDERTGPLIQKKC
jgi:hypothetical protein